MTPNPDPTHIKVSNDGKTLKIKSNGFSNTFPAQDTINLQWAFNNYPHADYNLGSGIFHISETIEAANYQGRIQGKGKDKTFITGRGPSNGVDYVFPLLNDDLTARLYPTRVPSMIWFHAISNGNVNDWKKNGTELVFRDLTISLDGVGPEITYYDQPFRSIWFNIIVTGYNAVLPEFEPGNDEVSHTKLCIENVNFLAKRTPYMLNGIEYDNYNTASAMICYGGEYWTQIGGLNGYFDNQHSPINQQIQISNCRFKGFHQFGTGFEGTYTAPPLPPQTITYQFPTAPAFEKSRIHIHDNVYDDIGDGAGLAGSLGQNIIVLANMGTEWIIENNKFFDIQNIGVAFASGVAETLPTATSTFLIRNNLFQHAHSAIEGSSIVALDVNFFLNQPYIIIVKKNKFVGDDGYAGNFVNLSIGTSAHVSCNEFQGDYGHAITAGNDIQFGVPFPYFLANITENNFNSYGTHGTNIVLGDLSFNSYVEVPDASFVQNSGFDNIIVVKDLNGKCCKVVCCKYEGCKHEQHLGHRH